MADDIVVENKPERHRYEASIDGKVAGYAEYQLTPALIVFTHTEVEPDHEGKGVGSALVRFALEDVRDEGQRKVLPLCPFVKAWISRHPGFFPLVFGPPASNVRD